MAALEAALARTSKEKGDLGRAASPTIVPMSRDSSRRLLRE